MKQTSGTAGISHRYNFKNGGVLQSTMASVYTKNKAQENYYKDANTTTPYLDLDNRYLNLILTTAFDKKYSATHTNKSGVTLTHMDYTMNLGLSPFIGENLETISKGKGNTNLISAYSSSLFTLSNSVSATLGVNSQVLSLNGQWTVEPRVSVRWQSSPKKHVGTGLRFTQPNGKDGCVLCPG